MQVPNSDVPNDGQVAEKSVLIIREEIEFIKYVKILNKQVPVMKVANKNS